MRPKNPFPGACAGIAAWLLAVTVSGAQAAGPAQVVLNTSIKSVETAPITGPADPHRPFISRASLKLEESAATMPFEVTLKMRNFAELQARVASGKPVPPAELAAKYEPLPTDYQAVADWLTGRGLTITRRDGHHMAIFARGTVSQIEQAMQVNFARVTLEGKDYTSAVTAPSVPATISPLLVGINGLQPHIRAHKHLRKPQARPNATSANNTSYTPSQIEQAYQASGLYSSNINGAGQTIAIVIDTFPSRSDLRSFGLAYGLSQLSNNTTNNAIQFIQVVTGTLPAVSGEETLDTEWSSAMAPGARVRVYATLDLGNAELDEGYQQVYDDVTLHPELAIHEMSMSYGGGETDTTSSQVQTDDQYFVELTNAGVTIFASSGDGGSTPDANGGERGPLQVESPASDPNVTGVGGTSLTLNSGNNETSEVVWNNSGSASGGGTSIYFNRPTWQTGTGVGGGTMRLVPDIACAADPELGADVYYTDPVEGLITVLGGTSWATPTCAGFCALINQARANQGLPSLGQLGPHLYPLIGTSNFRDITSGNNATNRSGGKYNATTGYDEATGIGVPLVQTLATTLTGAQTPATAQQQPAVNTVTPGQNATFTVTASGNPQSYQWQRMPIGTTTWSNLSNTATYSGSATASLTVNDTTVAMSGDEFQCVVTYASPGTAINAPSSLLIVEFPLIITTLAGNAGTAGFVNTPGTGAQFDYPSGVAVDGSGNVYVADFSNNVIREVTPSGVVTTPYGSTAGTAGSTNGAGNNALFNTPNGVATDGSGNLYVADTGNNLIRKITLSSGEVNTLGGVATFNAPEGIAVDGAGNVYVADTSNDTIRKIATNGIVSILAGQTGNAGFADGNGTTQALFNAPTGLAVDGSGNVYVADFNNYVIRKITSGGVVSTIAGQSGIFGYRDGPSAQALFNAPTGVAVDGSGNLYVTDSLIPPPGTSSGNNLVRMITPAGVVSTIAGLAGITGSADGTGPAAQFFSVQAVTFTRTGTFYFADTYNQTVRAGIVQPLVTVSATQPNAAVFGPVAGQFTVTRTGSTLASLTVNYSVAGTAVANTDYTALAGALTIPAGASSATITVNPLANSLATTNRTVQVTLTTSTANVALDPTVATVTIAVLTPYQAWKLSEFGSNAYVSTIGGDLADPNNNGVPNLLEYAFNSDPLQTGTEPSPTLSIVSDSGGNPYLALTYTQINTDPSLIYTVQVTSDLNQQTDQWHSGPAYTTLVSQQVNGTTTQVTVRDNTPLSQTTQRFIRLQVTEN